MKAWRRTDSRGWERLTRPITSLLTLALLVGPLAFSGAAEEPCSSPPKKEWRTISVGSFSSGEQKILDYAVSPSDPNLIYVTNGQVLLVSRDAGCGFVEIFDLATADLSYSTTDGSITDLDVGWDGGPRVYLAIRAFGVQADLEETVGQDLPLVEKQNAVLKPHVVVGSDGGSSWHEADEGLEGEVGPPIDLSAGPDSSAYLLVDPYGINAGQAQIETTQKIFGTTGGAWDLRSEFGELSQDPDNPLPPPDRVDDLEIDPSDAMGLWMFGPHGIFRSIDGGRAIAPTGTTTPTGGADVFQPSGGVPHVIAHATTSGTLFVSSPDTAGDQAGFDGVPAHGIPQSVTHTLSNEEFAFTNVHGHVYYRLPFLPAYADLTDPDKAIFDIQSTHIDGAAVLHGRTLTTLQMRMAPEQPPPKEHILDAPSSTTILPDDLLDLIASLGQPRLVPAYRRVELRPGEREVLDYRLQLPGRRKVDIGFLVDMSGTMQQEIDGLRAAMSRITNDLIEAKFHAHFGIAGYRDWEREPAYKRFRDIGPPDDALEAALNQVTADGGTHETALSALYQLATGTGQSDDAAHYIQPGKQFNFRRDAFHLVVHATDEEFTEATEHQPSFVAVADVMRDVRAQQAGLAFVNTEPEESIIYWTGPQTESLKTMATLTGAFAPATGVDCGDHQLAPGDPLVCFISSDQSLIAENMGRAIVELVKSLDDQRTVSLEFDRDAAVVTNVIPASWNGVDFKLPGQLPFQVEVQCPPSGWKDVYNLDVLATARGETLASARADVVCRPRGIGQTPASLLFPPVPPPPPPGRPAQPQSPAQPVQNLASQAQSQSQAQAQAAIVPQRQQQPQVAMVTVPKTQTQFNTATRESGAPGEHLMSRYTRSRFDRPLPLTIAGFLIAAALGTAFGLAYQARSRVIYARQNKLQRGWLR